MGERIRDLIEFTNDDRIPEGLDAFELDRFITTFNTSMVQESDEMLALKRARESLISPEDREKNESEA